MFCRLRISIKTCPGLSSIVEGSSGGRVDLGSLVRRRTYMQHHAVWDGTPGSVGSLSINMSSERSNAAAWSPGGSNGAVGVGVKGLEGHEALE
jgi:hypothetical protein